MKNKKCCNFFPSKIPVLGGFNSFLWIFFQLFFSIFSIFIFSIFPCFNAILLHRRIFCHLYMHFMFFRWLRHYILLKQCTCEESYIQIFFVDRGIFSIKANFGINLSFFFFLHPPPTYITLYHQSRRFYDKKWKLPNENQYMSLLCGQHDHICVQCEILFRAYSSHNSCRLLW